MVALQHWFTLLISQWLTALPWLILGVAVSTVLFLFAPRHRWETYVPQNSWFQLLYGFGLGLILPVGQPGAFPITRRLLWQSGSSSLAIAFWLTTVSIQPVILWRVWQVSAESGGIGLFYLILSLLVVLVVAGIFTTQQQTISHVHGDETPYAYPAIARPSSYQVAIAPIETNTLSSAKLNILPVARKSRISTGFYTLTREMVEWSLWLLFGCIVAASLQTFAFPFALKNLNVWTPYFAGIISPGGLSQQVAIAEHWLQQGNAGHGLGFLLGNVFISIQSLCLMVNTFRLKALGYLALLLFLLTLLANLWLNFYVF